MEGKDAARGGRDAAGPEAWGQGSDAEERARIVALFRQAAWEAVLANLDENGSELEDYVSDYEDETGAELDITPKQELTRGGELEDPRFAAWCRNAAEERGAAIGQGIASLVRRGTITAWRAVGASSKRVAKAMPAGVHWTFTRSCVGAVFEVHGEGEATHVVRARVPLASIDWDRTVKANMSEESGCGEDELRLCEGAPVQVMEVSLADG